MSTALGTAVPEATRTTVPQRRKSATSGYARLKARHNFLIAKYADLERDYEELGAQLDEALAMNARLNQQVRRLMGG
jgi:molybdenum-dependent DNA-binding transcriptional regulator ModE